MARPETGAIRLEVEDDLAVIVGVVLRHLDERLLAHHMPFDLPADLPLVRVNAGLIAQAHGNLIENAALDLGLPDIDGIEVIRGIRQWSSLSILLLSARTQELRKIEALDAGADDYIMKPCGVGELLARVRVALRHALRPSTGIRTLRFSRAVVDLERRLVTHEGQAVHLTPIEFRLLGCLARHVGMVVTHRQLLSEVWGPTHEKDTHYLRIYMKQLREKLEEDPVRPRQLITEVGIGYRLLEGEGQDDTSAPA